MPRAHRYFLPGHVWHITHRCHKQEFLLKFAKDRQCWRHWLFEARKRYGLCVLNFIITSNHIHLLVLDRGEGEIAQSMQLVAGRTGQAYNQRKNRKGAFWEDRYHATAVDADTYMARCMVYIDLNMVRAGVVRHPENWIWSGYSEIQSADQRYTIINRQALIELFGMNTYTAFQHQHKAWVEDRLKQKCSQPEPDWSHSIAVGAQHYLENFKSALGADGMNSKVVVNSEDDLHALKEPATTYSVHFRPEKGVLSGKNTVFLE